MAVKEGDDSVLLGWPGLITCAQFVVVLNEKTSKTEREREREREREESERKRETEGEQSTHSCALLLALSLSFSLILVSIRKTSKSQLETGKQPPESCPAQHGANVSDIGDNSAFFLAKKLNGNGACGWSSWSPSMTQHFVVMHRRHVHVQLWRRAKQRNGKRIRHRETLATETRLTCQCQLIVKGNASSREERRGRCEEGKST